MSKVTAELSNDTYKKLQEDIRLGIFKNVSEAINSVVR
jgi:Arc/MetJ-type ribon-helix-helix transcriptional regulator